MKLIIFLFLISFSSIASNDPMELVNAFAKPLQEEGVKGIDKALEGGKMADNPFYIEAAKQAGKEVESVSGFKTKLKETLVQNGKLKSATKMGEESRLRGHSRDYTVELEFHNGQKKRIRIYFIKSSTGGNYDVMKTEFLNW